MSLVPSFLDLVQPLSWVMTTPSFMTFVTLLAGWVFTRRHTVTGMILAAGAVGAKHHSSFHRLFATASWSLDELGLAVFGLLEPWLGRGSVFLALDDTLARKRGLKVFGAGMHHDPLLSTRKVALTNWGHSWVVLGVIVRFPFRADRCFCLPILFRLYRSQQTIARQGGGYRTRPELAVEMLEFVCGHRPERRFHAVADSAYGGQSVLRHLPRNCDLTSRLVLDARLHEAPEPRGAGKSGRPRRRGRRLPTPRQMLAERAHRMTLDLYGRHDRVRIAEGIARVYAVPERALRVVAVEPLTGGRTIQAFYSTCVTVSAVEVLTWYARRWSIEQTFQESKMHLGFEEPQGWTRRAVERTAPTAMLLYSLIVLWFAKVGHRHRWLPSRPWYQGKSQMCFADMLTTLRRESVRSQVLSQVRGGRGLRNLTRTLLHTVQQAA